LPGLLRFLGRSGLWRGGFLPPRWCRLRDDDACVRGGGLRRGSAVQQRIHHRAAESSTAPAPRTAGGSSFRAAAIMRL
jgi:hypothetical protein